MQSFSIKDVESGYHEVNKIRKEGFDGGESLLWKEAGYCQVC